MTESFCVPPAVAPRVIYLWCNPQPVACPRCGGECCSAQEIAPGEWVCAGRCDPNGRH